MAELDEETKDDLEQAAVNAERNKTKYGDKLPEDYREDSDD